jgi:hypothetical protein
MARALRLLVAALALGLAPAGSARAQLVIVVKVDSVGSYAVRNQDKPIARAAAIAAGKTDGAWHVLLASDTPGWASMFCVSDHGRQPKYVYVEGRASNKEATDAARDRANRLAKTGSYSGASWCGTWENRNQFVLDVPPKLPRCGDLDSWELAFYLLKLRETKCANVPKSTHTVTIGLRG